MSDHPVHCTVEVACTYVHISRGPISGLLSISACNYVYTPLLPLLPQVTKLVRSGEVGGEERRRVFDAVGFSFINRLLATCESPLSYTNLNARCNVS